MRPPNMTHRALLALAVAMPLLVARVAHADAPPVVVWRYAKDPRWVHGQAIVNTTPGDVWARIQRVDEWPTLFSDIKWLKVIERSPTHWRVRLESNTMTCGSHDYHIRFDANRVGQVIIDAPGTTSVAYFQIFDGGTPTEARVTYSLFVEMHGIVSWFVSERVLREKQTQMVDRYLHDIDRIFHHGQP